MPSSDITALETKLTTKVIKLKKLEYDLRTMFKLYKKLKDEDEKKKIKKKYCTMYDEWAIKKKAFEKIKIELDKKYEEEEESDEESDDE
jgi:thymidylate synthase